MEKFFESSTIYETFSPFNKMLCFCGFFYNGCSTKGKHKASVAIVKMVLSLLYSLLFATLFVMNVLWGQKEPESVQSFLLKHGWYKLFLSELIALPIIIWNNFYHRKMIDRCLQLIHQYDVACQVNIIQLNDLFSKIHFNRLSTTGKSKPIISVNVNSSLLLRFYSR